MGCFLRDLLLLRPGLHNKTVLSTIAPMGAKVQENLTSLMHVSVFLHLNRGKQNKDSGSPKKLIKKTFLTKLFNALFASTNTELGHNEEQGAQWFLNITIISYSLTQKVTKNSETRQLMRGERLAVTIQGD